MAVTRRQLKLVEAADVAWKAAFGSKATFVVNRNINYTNVCSYGCTFCAFSPVAPGGGVAALRAGHGAATESPYPLSFDEISETAAAAVAAGATEVCLQGGIHPSFTLSPSPSCVSLRKPSGHPLGFLSHTQKGGEMKKTVKNQKQKRACGCAFNPLHRQTVTNTRRAAQTFVPRIHRPRIWVGGGGGVEVSGMKKSKKRVSFPPIHTQKLTLPMMCSSVTHAMKPTDMPTTTT